MLGKITILEWARLQKQEIHVCVCVRARASVCVSLYVCAHVQDNCDMLGGA